VRVALRGNEIGVTQERLHVRQVPHHPRRVARESVSQVVPPQRRIGLAQVSEASVVERGVEGATQRERVDAIALPVDEHEVVNHRRVFAFA